MSFQKFNVFISLLTDKRNIPSHLYELYLNITSMEFLRQLFKAHTCDMGNKNYIMLKVHTTYAIISKDFGCNKHFK